MSIVKLNKATILGVYQQKEALLERIQEFSGLHVNSLRENHLAPEISGPSDIQNIRHALNILEETPNKRQYLKQERFDAHKLVAEVLQIKQDIEQTREDILNMTQSVDTMRPWGDFPILSPTELQGNQFWFYKVPSKDTKLVKTQLPYQVVGKDNMYTYIIVVSKEPAAKSDMPVLRTNIGEKRLHLLEQELDQLKTKLEDLFDRRRLLTQYRYLLAQHISEFEELTERLEAMHSTLDEDNFFILSAWIPEQEVHRLEKLCEDNHLAVVIEQPNRKDQVPTLLENNKYLDSGELLVDFYQNPGYETIDPSGIIFISFSIFFAIIMSDAGYALILTGVFLYNFKRLKKAKKGKQLINLFSTICFCSLLYGVLTGNYFSMTLSPSNPLNHLKIIPANDFKFMMKLSIGIGVFHIILANILIALKTKHLFQRAKSIGFIVLVLSGVMYVFTSSLQATVAVLGVGALILVLGSGEQKIHGIGTIIIKLIKGALSITSITALFGDIMSYMRLFALGIAGTSLAATFNDLASNVMGEKAGIGVLLALIIVLFGHGLNFLLSIMSGVVHGLRLNYIEFFNWSIPEEGRKFKKFSKKEEINYD